MSSSSVGCCSEGGISSSCSSAEAAFRFVGVGRDRKADSHEGLGVPRLFLRRWKRGVVGMMILLLVGCPPPAHR